LCVERGRCARVRGPVLDEIRFGRRCFRPEQACKLGTAMRAQYFLGNTATYVRRYAEEAEQCSTAARHRGVMNLAQRALGTASLSGQALAAPERFVIDGDVLGVRRHPGRG